MASKRVQTFSEYGPPAISNFDWDNLYHRTSVVSCLVQGVYRMEKDGLNSAEDWWECVGFTLDKPLIDKIDDSIYGAVFQKGNNHHYTRSAVVPQYVIAFRGTIVRKENVFCDMKNNIRIFFENIHCGKRFKQMIQVIQNYVNIHGNTAVWIAGHSLGAGLALCAGKVMAKSGFPVEAYIFNPPSSLIPLEQLVKRHEKLKSKVRFARDIFKASMFVGAQALLDEEVLEDHTSFTNLASWSPHLFVNQSDPICSEYKGHFLYKDQMAAKGRKWIEKLAAGCSFRSLIFGRGKISSPQHLHFLPSAFLIENKIKLKLLDFRTKHGIHQWWNPELEHQSTMYEFHS